MKKRAQVEKIGVVVLAGLCLFLIFRLVSEIMGNPTPATRPAATAYKPSQRPVIRAENSAKRAKGSAGSDSTLEMQSLDQYQAKPLPDLGRNPFDFGPPPLTPAQKAAQAQAARGMGGAMTASSGPAQPHMPLRAIGYSERTGVGPEAYLADADNVFVVHDGDVVSKRFKVLSITSMTVEIQDGASGEKAQLPIPVVQ
jgi:hypothetical protein